MKREILLIVFAFIHISFAAPPRTCESVGGCAAKKGCLCLDGKQLDFSKDSCDAVDLEKFCEHPGRILCQSSAQRNASAIKAEFDKIDREIFDAVKDEVIKANPNNKAWESKSPYFEQFHNEVSRQMQERLLTEDRVNKARELVERARKTFRGFLSDRLKLYMPAPDLPPEADWVMKPGEAEKKIATLKEMIRKIDRATLEFRVISSRSNIPGDAFNASASPTHNSISIGGMILYTDSAPQSLFLILMHEFGHLIQPDQFPVDLSNPFDREIQCLKSQRKFNRTPSLLNEAFADWIAVEGYRSLESTRFSYPTRDFTADENRHLPLECRRNPLGRVLEFSKIPHREELEGLISKDCSLYAGQNESHPTSIDRIEGIILAHPQFSLALGCKSKVQKPGDEPPTGVKYCGLDLYQQVKKNPVPVSPDPKEEPEHRPEIRFVPAKNPPPIIRR